MKILVTGSSGHLGEALVRTIQQTDYRVIGLDCKKSAFTNIVGSITDRNCVRHCLDGVDAVIHTATLHKPHVATHTSQAFVDVNISGTLNLLEEAVSAGVKAFVFTSTTSTFGQALTPPECKPAVWVTEELKPIPKNIYGVTKIAAEDLCELIRNKHGLPCLILRTSRFFPEEDDNLNVRSEYEDTNLKVNEYLHRRVDLQDVVDAHLLAMEKAADIGFDRFIVSATTPFQRDDVVGLRKDARAVLKQRVPEYEGEYNRRGWKMFPNIGRVYDNTKARTRLGWQPEYDFRQVIHRLNAGNEYLSPLAIEVGSKGYHDHTFADGPYPVH